MIYFICYYIKKIGIWIFFFCQSNLMFFFKKIDDIWYNVKGVGFCTIKKLSLRVYMYKSSISLSAHSMYAIKIY